MHRDSGVTSGSNRLLDALPIAETESLRRSLRPVTLEVKELLFEPGQAIDFVYFPRNCVVSLVSLLHEGDVEVATIGNEGIVGVPLLLGHSPAVRAVCSVEGWADRIEASTFLDEVVRSVPLSDLVNDYIQAL